MSRTNAKPPVGGRGLSGTLASDGAEYSAPNRLGKQGRRARADELDDIIRQNGRADTPLADALRAALTQRAGR